MPLSETPDSVAHCPLDVLDLFFFSSWPLGFPTLRTREFALLPVRSKSNKSLLAGNQRVAALPVPDALLATALCTQGCAQVQVEEGGRKVY